MKEKNWSYLAGLFDGEGCACISKIDYHGKGTAHSEFGYRIDIHITMTHEPVIKWILSNFGGVYYGNTWTTEHNPKWKPAYRWVPKGKANKEKLLLGMLPYLIVKRDIALVCLEFLRLTGICPEEREIFFRKARKLTKRGISVETNTLDAAEAVKIESDLISDYESAPLVIADA